GERKGDGGRPRSGAGRLTAAWLVLAACLASWGAFAQDNATASTGTASHAQSPAQSPSIKRLKDYDMPGMTNRLNLTSLDVWDVGQLIDFLAHRGGLSNIVIGRGVAGLTTKLKFDNVTVGDALEVVLSVNHLAYEVSGDILTIMTDEEHQARRGASFYDNKKVRVVELKYADPNHAAKLIGSVKSTIGTVVADPITGSVILIDTPEKIAEMEAILSGADLSTISRVLLTETRGFVLQYANTEDIFKEVLTLLSKEAGSARMNREAKTLMVTDLPHILERVKQLIELFDQPPKQVFIEAKITETTLNDDFGMGINWKHLFEGLDPRFRVNTALTPLGASALPSPAAALTFNTIAAGQDLNVILEALKAFGKTEILAEPHISVLDGQEAKIKVIEDQPYKEITLESGTTNVTGVTYLFKEVGVQLGVTPKINDENFIRVCVKPEISSISDWYDGAPQEGTPVVRKAYAETTVMVKDGVTIIIGGMIKDRRSTRTQQVPLLGSIPLLGHLFRYETVSLGKAETVVFMTPHIVTGEQYYQRERDVKKDPKPLRRAGNGENRQAKPVR
ncbi:MAG: hypothetical protein QME60_03940, partial [Verrucomicrobiota bacterium]|nr:hypothetical protein [Verrucomicrobiota bacterium]